MGGGCGHRAIDRLEDWLNFFGIKTRHYARMSYSTKHLDMNQLFMWKFVCASIIFTFSVILPTFWMPWGGFTVDGHENSPALLYFSVATALLSSVSMGIASFNASRVLDNSRVIVQRRIRACSWEMLDWVLYQITTTATLVAFVAFYLVQLPTSSSKIHILRIQGVLVHSIVVAIDFYFTTTEFRTSHVFLALLWPPTWLAMQFVWIVDGHQPSSELIDFHTWHAPLSVLGMYAATIGVFLGLQRLALRLRVQPSLRDEAKFGRRSSSASELEMTPHRGGIQNSLAQYDLMPKSQRMTHVAPLRTSTAESSDMESGVYRIGSDATNSEDDHHVIAMGSWAGELPHSHHGDARTSVHHLR